MAAAAASTPNNDWMRGFFTTVFLLLRLAACGAIWPEPSLGRMVTATAGPPHLCKTYSRSARDTLMAVTMTTSAVEAVEAAKLMDCSRLAILPEMPGLADVQLHQSKVYASPIQQQLMSGR